MHNFFRNLKNACHLKRVRLHLYNYVFFPFVIPRLKKNAFFFQQQTLSPRKNDIKKQNPAAILTNMVFCIAVLVFIQSNLTKHEKK